MALLSRDPGQSSHMTTRTSGTDSARNGDRVGPYRLLETLGRGGVALVYRAVHVDSGDVVALKTVRAASEANLASVRREIHALGRIKHPGIVKILDGGITEGRPWYAMELLEGGTLRQHLSAGDRAAATHTTEETLSPSQGPEISGSTSDAPSAPRRSRLGFVSAPLPAHELAWFLTLIRRLCEPVAHVHGEGFIHRDIKPSNIWVRLDGSPVLMDFGLVWLLQEERSREILTVDAARGGTVAYMSPEQARGERVDARADLFSLGCVMYEGLTGQRPFPAETRDELLFAHAGKLLPPSELTPGLPRALDELVLGLLSQHPRDRIGHASDVAAILGDLGAAGSAPAPDARAKAYLYRPELVGRGALLDKAREHLADLQRGRGGCALIAGESGIGKTSFVSAAAHLAAARGIRVVTGQCAAIGLVDGRGLRRGGPFYPLAKLLQAIGDRCTSGGAEITAQMLGDRAKVLAAAEPSLRDVPGVQSAPEPAEVPGEAARRRLLDALAETLTVFAQDRPTLLVLDDLQWADDLTLAFLAALSERYLASNRLLIMATYRSEESTPDIERLAAMPHVDVLHLDRLDAATIGAMSADMLGQREVPGQLAPFLAQESSGNPFFVAEYLRAAVDAGLLYRDDRGRWKQADGRTSLDRLGLPNTIAALVTRRLDSLEAAAGQMAVLASVLGREVEVDALTALAISVGVSADEPAVEDTVRTLLVRQVLEASAPGAVRFVHDKLREIAYEGLTPDRQRALHGAAATLLERRHATAGTLDAAAESLAHHFEKADDVAKALVYLDRAGEAAHAMHANLEAVRVLEKANALEGRASTPAPALSRARRNRLLGVNALAMGNVNLALSSLTNAVMIAGKPWPSSRAHLALRCLSAIGAEIKERWLPWVPSGAAPDGATTDLLLEAARAYERLLAVNYFATGDMAAVMLCALTNMTLSEKVGRATGELALGYATFGAMCSLMPADAMAQSYCRRAVEVARASQDEVAESWVLVNVGLVHLQACRWDEMRQSLEQVRTIARRLGFSRRWEEATSQFSTACFLAGHFSEARRLNDELLSSVERADPQSKCWAVVRQAELCLVEGDVAGAARAGAEGLELCQKGLGRAEQIFALGPVMLARLWTGDRDGAMAAASSCAEWIDKGTAPVFYNTFAYAALAEVYLQRFNEETDPARRKTFARLARKAVKGLRKIAFPMAIATPRAALWRGMEAVLVSGDAARATSLFEDCLARARALAMPYDEGLALAALAKHGSTDAATRAAREADAAAVFSRIGATSSLERLRATP
jgi:serine/threonine protein kinase